MSARERLCIVPSIRARSGGGERFLLTRKFVDGVREYIRRWPGPVRVILERTEEPDANLDPINVDPAEAGLDLQWLPEAPAALGNLLLDSRVVLGTLVPARLQLTQLCRDLDVPLVFITENSVRTRRQMIATSTQNPLLRLRRQWWTTRLEHRYIRALRSARGVQCNGTPTFEAYRDLTPNPLLYFDTRLPRSLLVDEPALQARIQRLLAGGPLRLAFSGRLLPIKGADHLPRVACELRRLNVRFTMDICGVGPLESSMRDEISRQGLSDVMRMRGVLDFHDELMPLMAESVDLFVCCHRQGDPSCTYLETLSCGTPIAGYDNEAWRGLSKVAGAGWTTPMDNPLALARKIAELDRDRPALAAAARQSRAFALHHTFESTMQARIDHLLRCAGAAQVDQSPAAAEALA
jgi:glycosyltransferase involved in cell wall biosynthesis